MNEPRISGRKGKPVRNQRSRSNGLAADEAQVRNATDIYLRGLGESHPLTRDAESELGRRIAEAEMAALRALVSSPAGPVALGALAADVMSGEKSVRELLLNPDAPDAAEMAARVAKMLENVRVREETGSSSTELADELAGIRFEPSVVDRVEEAIATHMEHFGPDECLRAEEARRMAKKARATAAAGKADLVRANLRLVVMAARQRAGRGVPLLDLIQEGNLGLIRAADKFDHRRGYRFGTYAAWWIRQSIDRALLYQGKDVRMPVHLTASRRRVLTAQRALSQEKSREPSPEEIAERSGVPLDKVQAVRALAMALVSLEAPMGDEGDLRFGDMLASPGDTPDEALERRRLQEQAALMLDELTPRERDILRLRYGLSGEEDHTLEEIGRSFSLSRERIRQIESKALEKLRAWSKERGLESYLEG